MEKQVNTTPISRQVFDPNNSQHVLLAINLWSSLEALLKTKYTAVDDWIKQLKEKENGVVLYYKGQSFAILEVDIFTGTIGKIGQIQWYTSIPNADDVLAEQGIEIAFLNGCTEAQVEQVFVEKRLIRIGKEQYNGFKRNVQNIKDQPTVSAGDSPSTTANTVGEWTDTVTDPSTKPNATTQKLILDPTIFIPVSNATNGTANTASTTIPSNGKSKSRKPKAKSTKQLSIQQPTTV